VRSFRTTRSSGAGSGRLAVAQHPPRTPCWLRVVSRQSVKATGGDPAIQADRPSTLQAERPPRAAISSRPSPETKRGLGQRLDTSSARTSVPGLSKIWRPDAPGPPGSAAEPAGRLANQSRGPPRWRFKALLRGHGQVVPTGFGRAGWRFSGY